VKDADRTRAEVWRRAAWLARQSVQGLAADDLVRIGMRCTAEVLARQYDGEAARGRGPRQGAGAQMNRGPLADHELVRRAFVDALRQTIGLRPLYQADREPLGIDAAVYGFLVGAGNRWVRAERFIFLRD
jgi:hypothetical protein